MQDTQNELDTKAISGAQTDMSPYLRVYSQRFVKFAYPFVPLWLETYHLTYLTFVWAALAIVFGYLGQHHSLWLLGVAFAILGHTITDALDGEVGRRRNTGLVRWGFYVDHFGDFIYLISILIGISFCIPESLHRLLMLLVGVWSAFFINIYFVWILRKKYTLSFFRIGPVEVQLGGMVLMIVFSILGVSVIPYFLYLLVPLSLWGLGVVFWSTQKESWVLDLKHKE